MSSKPKVVVIKRERYATRCHICLDVDIRDWLSDCLRKTIDGDHSRPTGSTVHRAIGEAFGEVRSPGSDNTTRRHLRDHEPLWVGWPGHET